MESSIDKLSILNNLREASFKILQFVTRPCDPDHLIIIPLGHSHIIII